MILIPRCLLLLSLSASLASVAMAESLEVMKEPDFRKLVQQEQFVIGLFCDDDDNSCEDWETELTAVREDLVDSLNAWVVKVVDGNHVRRFFNPDTSKPTVVFFRSTTPVLYDGAADEDEMLAMFYRFKDPCLVELIDDNFEHLTQAATGATTGDWFVQFFRDDCEECEAQRARLEGLACALKGRVNVAMVNKSNRGAVTGRRFSVGSPPSYIFFRLGKMYRYTIEKFDIKSLTNFATGFYKNVKAESIPMPKTPFDDMVQLCVDYLNEYPALFAVMVAIPVALVLLFYFLMKSDREKPKIKKKKAKAKVATKDGGSSAGGDGGEKESPKKAKRGDGGEKESPKKAKRGKEKSS